MYVSNGFDQCLNVIMCTIQPSAQWTVFISAPAAFFLQDWAEFNRKYYYLQHRVMEWMIDVHHNPFPTPHPCVRYPAVFELPYETLKSRFEFALKTGLKSPVAAMKDSSTKKNKIDVQSLFLYPLEDYLTTIAPAVTEEEYYVFERMVEEYPDEEDRKDHVCVCRGSQFIKKRDKKRASSSPRTAIKEVDS